MKRILSIDGGGIKGVAPAAFLASLEQLFDINVGDYFDLVVGTSTGGIIALGLGAGLSAKQILDFYCEKGPTIFKGNRLLRAIRWLPMAKYSQHQLKIALEAAFGDITLGQSRVRLVVPAANLETGTVHIFKTQHHPRLQTDYHERMVDVALATAAAPSYFPTQRLSSGIPLIDGGVWANNPVGFAVVEAISMLGWPRDELKVMSLGCTTAPLSTITAIIRPTGAWYWARKITDVFMSTQSSASLGIAQHLAGHDSILRISPEVSFSRFALDDARDIKALAELGSTAAHEAADRVKFLFETKADRFVPIVGDASPRHTGLR